MAHMSTLCTASDGTTFETFEDRDRYESAMGLPASPPPEPPPAKLGRFPVRRALLRRIEDRGGWLPIIERLADGETLAAIARDYEVSRSFFYRFAIAFDGERLKEYQMARRLAGDAYLEQGLDIVDTCDAKSSGGVKKAQLQAEYRKYLYDKYNPQPTVNLHFNIGELHLNALRAVAITPPNPTP